MGKRSGKIYNESLGSFDRRTHYALEEAVSLVKNMPHKKFDETVELHVRLGIDPKKSDQQVRGAISLPHGIGKTLRVVAFAEGEKAIFEKTCKNKRGEFCQLDYDLAIKATELVLEVDMRLRGVNL